MIISKLENKIDIPYSLLLQADPNKQQIDRYLRSGDIYCTRKDNKVIGAYILKETGTNQAEIMNIAVSPDFQQQGIGKKLLDHAIDQAKQRNVHSLHICTGNSSIHQLALYQKAGFRITEVEKDFFLNNYPEEIIENGIQCRDKIRLTFSYPHVQSSSSDEIIYKTGIAVEADQAAEVFEHSGIKRPYHDLERIRMMLANANLLVTAWHNDQLIGLARALTDYSYCCYLSDLAVRKSYQQKGIGKKMIEIVQSEIGDQASLVLLSAPQAMAYYPKVGFQQAGHAFFIPRKL